MRISNFDEFVNESSHSDFTENYSSELRKSLSHIKDLAKSGALSEMDDKVKDQLSKKMSVYDKNVEGQIFHWVGQAKYSSGVNVNDIANFAIDNMNRFGTEPQMVLDAIETFYTVAKRILPDSTK
jgi:hypothetical protein